MCRHVLKDAAFSRNIRIFLLLKLKKGLLTGVAISLETDWKVDNPFWGLELCFGASIPYLPLNHEHADRKM